MRAMHKTVLIICVAIYNASMRLARSVWRKAIVTTIAVGGFVSLYEVTILDSKFVGYTLSLGRTSAIPTPGDRLAFTATAYCKGLLTTSGVAAQNGIAAADPLLLPVGSVVQMATSDGGHDGIYTVLDTGPSVHGHEIDIYIWSCNEALQFGRRPVTLSVLRLGWSPRASATSFLERILKRPQPDPTPLPSRPLPLEPK